MAQTVEPDVSNMWQRAFQSSLLTNIHTAELSCTCLRNFFDLLAISIDNFYFCLSVSCALSSVIMQFVVISSSMSVMRKAVKFLFEY
jgi:hypothetical protein